MDGPACNSSLSFGNIRRRVTVTEKIASMFKRTWTSTQRKLGKYSGLRPTLDNIRNKNYALDIFFNRDMHGLEKENLPTQDRSIYSAIFAAGTKAKERKNARADVWVEFSIKNPPEFQNFKDPIRPVPPHHSPASLEIDREKPSSASYPRQSMEGILPKSAVWTLRNIGGGQSGEVRVGVWDTGYRDIIRVEPWDIELMPQYFPVLSQWIYIYRLKNQHNFVENPYLIIPLWQSSWYRRNPRWKRRPSIIYVHKAILPLQNESLQKYQDPHWINRSRFVGIPHWNNHSGVVEVHLRGKGWVVGGGERWGEGGGGIHI